MLCCKVCGVVVNIIVVLKEQTLRVLRMKSLVWAFRGAGNFRVPAEVLLKASCLSIPG